MPDPRSITPLQARTIIQSEPRDICEVDCVGGQPHAPVERVLSRDDADVDESLSPDGVHRENIVNFVEHASELGAEVVDVVHEVERKVTVDTARSHVRSVHARTGHSLVKLTQLQR